MAAPRILDETDLTDIITGACLLGSGGGGPLAVAKELVADLLHLGPVRLLDPADIADDTPVAVLAIDGSPTAALQGPFPYQVALRAFDELDVAQQRSSHKGLGAVLAIEVGAGNSLIPMLAAAARDIPLVDGAGVGRAVPQLTMCSFALSNVPISPIAVADMSTQVLLQVQDAGVAEPAVRALVDSGVFPNFAGIALWPMSGATMRGTVIPGLVTYARLLGQALRQAVARKDDPVRAALAYTGGTLLFKGRNLRVQQQTSGGFDLAQVTLQASDSSATCSICTTNENLIVWTTDQATPLAMAPDLICYLRTDGTPLSNADLSSADPQQEVAIIGVPAGPPLREPAMVARFLHLLGTVGYFGRYRALDAAQHGP